MPDLLRNESPQIWLTPTRPALSNATVTRVQHDNESTNTNGDSGFVPVAIANREADESSKTTTRLSPLEVRLLTQLREAPDRWLTALDLAKQVLGREDPNGEIMVRQYVFRLRK